jgi:hypothetical protein
VSRTLLLPKNLFSVFAGHKKAWHGAGLFAEGFFVVVLKHQLRLAQRPATAGGLNFRSAVNSNNPIN